VVIVRSGGLARSFTLKEMGMNHDTRPFSSSHNDIFAVSNAKLNKKQLRKCTYVVK
jgi:hypothetical protein